MPFYDLTCKNSHEQIDLLLKLGERPPCPTCGEATFTLWATGATRSIVADGIPGGYVVKHGLCNPDGSPRTYYSKSEMKLEADRRGLVNHSDLPEPKKRPQIFDLGGRKR